MFVVVSRIRVSYIYRNSKIDQTESSSKIGLSSNKIVKKNKLYKKIMLNKKKFIHNYVSNIK